MPTKLTQDLKKIVEWFFPEVVTASSNFISFVWISIYALSLTVFAIQFMPLMEIYNDSDVLVSVDVDDVIRLELPQITICPGRLFAKSNIKAVKQEHLYELPIIDQTQEEYVKRVLSVKSNINLNEDLTCPSLFFECTKISQCIPNVWYCDKNNDCVDESDEPKNCKSNYANETDEYCMKNWHYERCSNNSLKCAKFCNEDIECTNSEDEESCGITYSETNLTASTSQQRIVSHETFPLGYYDNSIQKSYIISPMNETYQYIEIQFNSFRLEAGDKKRGCIHDYVTIVDMTYNSIVDATKYCGVDHPNKTTLTGPVNITFHSDYINSMSGFEMVFRAVPSNLRRARRFWPQMDGDYFVARKKLSYNNKLKFQWKEIYNNLTKESPVDFSKIDEYLLFDSKVPHNFGTIASNFIIKASMPRYNKVIENFKEFLNAKCGKCYIIPANDQENKTFTVADSGIDSGISLVLFVNEDEDIGFYDRVGGSSITINAPGIYPLPHRNGILIKTGMTTRISLRKKTIKRKIKCTKRKPNWDPLHELWMAVQLKHKNVSDYEHVLNKSDKHEDPFNDWPRYNQDVCFEYCLHERIRNTCNCVNSYFNLYYEQDNDNSETPFPLCNPSNASEIRCMSNVTESFYSSERTFCDCPRSCSDETYQVKMAYGDFLSKQSMYYFINEVIDSRNEEPRNRVTKLLSEFLNNTITEEELLTKIRSNFAKIEIYFEDLQHDVFKERLAYSFQQLMSAFAGNIGMFVGWSVLTFSQVLMVFFHLSYHLFLKILQRANRTIR